jgi:hypothetical protein
VKFLGKILKGMAFLAVMLVITVSADAFQNPDFLKALNAWQKATYVAVEHFQPWTLLHIYEHAMTGPDGMDVPLPDTGPLAEKTTGSEVHLGYWAHGWPLLVVIPLAAADTVWHVFVAGSWLSSLIVASQIAMGLLWTVVCLVMFDPKNRMNDMWAVIILPLGTMILGSISSLVMQYLFELGLRALGWFTSFGGLCCAMGGTAAGLYTGGVKLAEITSHGAAESIKD